MSDQDDPPGPLIAPAVPLANILSTPTPSANWLWEGFLARGMPSRDESTLWRWLERAVAEGKILRAGTGRCNSPFKYWLKESEARWKRDPYYMPPLDPLYDHPDDKLPPLLPPSIRKLLEKRKKRRGEMVGPASRVRLLLERETKRIRTSARRRVKVRVVVRATRGYHDRNTAESELRRGNPTEEKR